MKKFPALVAAGFGAVSLAAAAPSMAAGPSAHTSGNLEYTSMRYVCVKGVPNYLLGVRAVKAAEKTVTVTQLVPHDSRTIGPVTHDKGLVLFSTINQAGHKITLTVKGNTSGSSFTVSGTIPSSCKGLPTANPGGAVTPPSKPTPGQPAPTKPGKPAPTKPGKPAPTKPAPTKPAPTKPAPTKPAPTKPGMGPKVDTDYVAPKSSSSTSGDLALAGLAFAAVAGGGVAVARRRG